MSLRCSCGAAPPDDARFCHKCGKPLFEEDVFEPAPAPVQGPVEPPLASPAPPGAAISFKNTRALGISALFACVAFLGFFASAMVFPPLWPLVLVAAGFFAVRVYNSKSPQPLTAAAGARLGWMTGLWLFVVIVIIATFESIVLSTPNGAETWNRLQQMPQLAQSHMPSAYELQKMMLPVLAAAFFVFTLLPGLGGLLGSRMGRRPQR